MLQYDGLTSVNGRQDIRNTAAQPGPLSFPCKKRFGLLSSPCILGREAQAAQAGFIGGSSMRKVLFWGTVIAGATAAYLMYRRGESLGSIASQTINSPVGSLVNELKTVSN